MNLDWHKNSLFLAAMQQSQVGNNTLFYEYSDRSEDKQYYCSLIYKARAGKCNGYILSCCLAVLLSYSLQTC